MKLKKGLFYVGLALGGLGFVAQNLEKKRKKLHWFRILMGVIIGVVMIVGYGMGQVFGKADSTLIQSVDGCAVVFGAAVWKNDQPSWALSDRVEAAIELYKNKLVKCFILSGGASTYGDHEVDVMKRLVLQAGVPVGAIRNLDFNGENTLATMTNLPPNTQSLVFVSNDFHMARIGLIAKRKNIENFRLHAAPYQQGRYTKNDEYFLREIGGYLLMLFGLKT